MANGNYVDPLFKLKQKFYELIRLKSVLISYVKLGRKLSALYMTVLNLFHVRQFD